MKVTGWTDFKDKRYLDLNEATEEEFTEMYNTVVKEIKDKGYKINGFRHQNGYAPIIDDKFLFAVSFRTWGGIMKEAYNLPNEDGLGYCLWAWTVPKDETEVLP